MISVTRNLEIVVEHVAMVTQRMTKENVVVIDTLHAPTFSTRSHTIYPAHCAIILPSTL